MFVQRICVQYKEQWADDTWTKPKLHTFKMIKYQYSTENYVEYNLVFYHLLLKQDGMSIWMKKADLFNVLFD